MITSIDDLVEFLRHFHRHRGVQFHSPPGFSPIPGDFPRALGTLYREMGALIESRHSPFGTQDYLIPLSKLQRVDGMIMFAAENQGCWTACCEPGKIDPPVCCDASDLPNAPSEAKGLVPVCPSLSHFLVTLCLQEAMFSSRRVISLNTDLPVFKAINEPLQPLWLEGRFVYTEPTHHFYTTNDRDVVVVLMYGNIWIGSPYREVTSMVTSGIRVHEIHGPD